jgi:hypothetical protein
MDGGMDGGNLFSDVKNIYNKKVKNTKMGDVVRSQSRKGLNLGYDKLMDLAEDNKKTKGLATIGRNRKEENVNRLMKMSGLGLRVSGDGLRVSGGRCGMCGAGNDKFLFQNQAL